MKIVNCPPARFAARRAGEAGKLKITDKHKAFTFVELLMAIAIVGIMTAVGFASLNSGKVTTKLQAAQREVASTIKLAQSYALQGKTVTPGGTSPCGYGFRFDPTDGAKTKYAIFYTPYYDTGVPTIKNCDQMNNYVSGGIHSYARYIAGQSQVLQSFTLKDGVTLSTSPDIYAGGNPNITEIYFTIPGGNIYGYGGAAYATRTFTFNLSDKTKTISIDSGGSVTEQ
jgi:prepilin-type N-terminal cleavage/methylation domain-containing protein